MKIIPDSRITENFNLAGIPETISVFVVIVFMLAQMLSFHTWKIYLKMLSSLQNSLYFAIGNTKAPNLFIIRRNACYRIFLNPKIQFFSFKISPWLKIICESWNRKEYDKKHPLWIILKCHPEWLVFSDKISQSRSSSSGDGIKSILPYASCNTWLFAIVPIKTFIKDYSTI